jgi:hypothetical protein
MNKNIWSKEEFPDQWKEFIIVPIYRNSDKTGCSYYCGTSLLSTSYEMLSNILLARLNPYIVTNQNLINEEMKKRLNR